MPNLSFIILHFPLRALLLKPPAAFCILNFEFSSPLPQRPPVQMPFLILHFEFPSPLARTPRAAKAVLTTCSLNAKLA
jgi:hypothetical protein